MKAYQRDPKRCCYLVSGMQRAQSTVEFAALMVVGVMILFLGLQLTLIGAAYLALGQMDDQAVRYAAVHADCDETSCTGGGQSVHGYMLSIGSPILTVNNGSYLSSTIVPVAPRTGGQTVTISTTYTIPSTILFLPNPFMGINFPNTLTDSRSAYSEN